MGIVALEAGIPTIVFTVIRREVAIVVVKAETRIGQRAVACK